MRNSSNGFVKVNHKIYSKHFFSFWLIDFFFFLMLVNLYTYIFKSSSRNINKIVPNKLEDSILSGNCLDKLLVSVGQYGDGTKIVYI